MNLRGEIRIKNLRGKRRKREKTHRGGKDIDRGPEFPILTTGPGTTPFAIMLEKNAAGHSQVIDILSLKTSLCTEGSSMHSHITDYYVSGEGREGRKDFSSRRLERLKEL